MRGSRAWVRTAAVGAALAAFGAVGFGTALAATPRAFPITCSAGYLCVQSFDGETVTVPAGSSQTFSPSLLMTGITNLTGENYCVSGDPNFDLPNGATLTRTESIYRVGPAEICAA